MVIYSIFILFSRILSNPEILRQLQNFQQMQQQQQVNEGSSQPKPVNVVSTVSQKKVSPSFVQVFIIFLFIFLMPHALNHPL